MGYNGHKNWETWAVRLHHDEWLYELSEELLESNPETTLEDLADYLKEQIDLFIADDCVGGGHGLLGEIVSGFLSEVDWRTIAEDQMEALKSEEE